MLCWLNNQFIDEAAPAVSVRDTGLLHAAGVFTTMRAYGGRVFRLAQHLARLRRSCDHLFIPLQYRDEALSAAVGELLARNDLSDARLRLTVTRGPAQHDPVHGLRLEPTCFLTATALEPWPREFYEKGMTVIVLDEQKLNPYDLQAGHKTLNYFSRLSALRTANQRSAGEALWFNVHNYLQSGSISNMFVVKNGRLITPPTTLEIEQKRTASLPYPRSAVLDGITRQAVLDLAARDQVQSELAAIDINGLLQADELFLTNSIMGVMPVCRVERKPLGNDRPGPVTRRLMEQYARLVEEP